MQATRPDPDLARVALARAVVDEIRVTFLVPSRRPPLLEMLPMPCIWTGLMRGTPLDTLAGYFDRLLAHEAPHVDHESAYILVFFLEQQIDYLRQTAKEIDGDFARNAG